MAESKEHHVKYRQYLTCGISYQPIRKAYNGVITLLVERFVFYDEYVDPQTKYIEGLRL